MKKTYTILLCLFSLTAAFSQKNEELFRPFFHFTPESNWINDPNGLVYFKGEYHLFFQYNPIGDQWGNMSWGHAVSKDLVKWEQLPVAIPATTDGFAFSGSAVIDWNNTSGFGQNSEPPMIAIYTSSSSTQRQFLAYSNDKGRTWINYSRNPIINLFDSDFRDPKVIWHEASKSWVMVVALSSKHKIRFYKSSDLKSWQLLQDFGEIGNQDGQWECPDLFALPVDGNLNNLKWVLQMSVNPPGATQYFVGNFDGTKFTADKYNSTGITILPVGKIFDDFESGTYSNWTVTGNAFGDSPAAGTLANQQTVSGFLGNRLVNSFKNGDGSQGKMISSSFVIDSSYISFLIGGGNHIDGTFIRLKINGQVISQSTGKNAEILKWDNWDVKKYIGQTAVIEIVDSVTGSWGHISIDHIIQTNTMQLSGVYDPIDFGKDFYAVQTFSDIPNTDGRRICIGWMNNWDYAGLTPTNPWRGMMSVPRTLELTANKGNIVLKQLPVKELQNLRTINTNFRNTTFNAVKPIVDNLKYAAFEIKTTISPNNSGNLGFKFRKGKNGDVTALTYDVASQTLIFDRSQCGSTLYNSNSFVAIQKVPLPLENNKIQLQILVDNSSIEIFGNNGKTVISNQIFPDSSSIGMEMFIDGGDAQIDSLDIWKLSKSSSVPTLDLANDKDVLIFPNPSFNDNLTIKTPDSWHNNISIDIFDSQGIEILHDHTTVPNQLIELSKINFPSSGIYFLSIRHEDIKILKKIILFNK